MSSRSGPPSLMAGDCPTRLAPRASRLAPRASRLAPRVSCLLYGVYQRVRHVEDANQEPSVRVLSSRAVRYRSNAEDCSIQQRLEIAAEGWLELSVPLERSGT